MYKAINDIFELQIETASKCNLKCPFCARTTKNGINPNLNLKEITIDEYTRALPSELIFNLKRIIFNGSYGDPLAASNFLDVINYFRQNKNISFSIFTNGSLRGHGFWLELAKKLNNPKDIVIFSIDGLATTNSKYRVGSDFQKIITNAKTFIENGGRARWDFLIFEHNKHEVEAAMALSKKIGFIDFNLKESSRQFFSQEDNNIIKPLSVNKHRQINDIISEFKSFTNYVNKTEIKCKFKSRNALFIDHNLRLWPCCWLGSSLYSINKNTEGHKDISKILGLYGNSFNSLLENSFSNVLLHKWIQNELENSWNTENGKLYTCGRTCGSRFEYSSDPKILPLVNQ
jgi:MoaA/NifB/PqqE/SkfB family radical SAM enzyme